MARNDSRSNVYAHAPILEARKVRANAFPAPQQPQLSGQVVLEDKVRCIHEAGHLKAKTDYTGFATDKKGSWTGILRKEIGSFADELAKKIGL